MNKYFLCVLVCAVNICAMQTFEDIQQAEQAVSRGAFDCPYIGTTTSFAMRDTEYTAGQRFYDPHNPVLGPMHGIDFNYYKPYDKQFNLLQFQTYYAGERAELLRFKKNNVDAECFEVNQPFIPTPPHQPSVHTALIPFMRVLLRRGYESRHLSNASQKMLLNINSNEMAVKVDQTVYDMVEWKNIPHGEYVKYRKRNGPCTRAWAEPTWFFWHTVCQHNDVRQVATVHYTQETDNVARLAVDMHEEYKIERHHTLNKRRLFGTLAVIGTVGAGIWAYMSR